MALDSTTEEVLALVKSKTAQQALRSWARSSRISLRLATWSASGRTSAYLLGVYAREAGRRPRSMVIKIKEGGDRLNHEREAHHKALDESGGFADEHLADLVYPPIPLADGGWIMFQRVAGGGFDELIGFVDMLAGHDSPAETCRLIVQSLLRTWNDKPRNLSTGSPAQVLTEILSWRLEPDGPLTAWAGAHHQLMEEPRPWLRHGDLELANPFALALDESLGSGVELVEIRGKVHGDLHPDNLLVTAVDADPPGFCLVDLSRYHSNWLLAWDPCYLMLTTAARYLPELDSHVRAELRQAIITSAQKINPAVPRELRHTIIGIVRAEREFAHAQDLLPQWNAQRLLCLTAAGLILSGRRFIDQPDREWFFLLAAHAATALLRQFKQFRPQDPMPLPEPLIRTGTAPTTAIPDQTEPALDSKPVSERTADDDVMLGREEEYGELYRALTQESSGVIVVHGPPGIGKSKLVHSVIADLGRQTSQRLRLHEMLPGARLDATTLADNIGNVPEAASATPSVEHPLARLEAALESTRGDQVTIVIDSAEHLLHGDSLFVGDSLDAALNALATNQTHRKSVVLVSSTLPPSSARAWLATARLISLGPMPYQTFVTYLRRLDDRELGISALPGPVLEQLHRSLQGNPRLAELFYAILTGDTDRADALADRVKTLDPSQVPTFLTNVLIRSLSPIRSRIMAVLAAFAIPVEADAVVAVLAEQWTREQVTQVLLSLYANHLVQRSGARYLLAPGEGERILAQLSADSRADLWQRAADELSLRRANAPQSVDDLVGHFAELKAVMHAGMFEAAYELVEIIDDVLRRWNGSALLFGQRQMLRDRLGDPYLAMANENALGEIFASRGEFDAAQIAYRQALNHAQSLNDRMSLVKIYINLAAMYLDNGDTGDAYNYFDVARDEARRSRNRAVEAIGLVGLADCHRRWGQYAHAIDRATKALSAATLGGDAPRSDVTSPHIALRLARWQAELGNITEGMRLLDKAEADAAQYLDDRLATSFLVERADLLLAQGEAMRARETAIRAVESALRYNSPPELLRARAALCMASLLLDEPEAASRAIRAAMHYRPSGHSLFVLALAAVVARRRGDRAQADQHFAQLLMEAAHRVERDARDFAAWDFKGLAVCGTLLDGTASLGAAVDAFRTARQQTPTTPAIVDRLRFLLSQMMLDGSQTEQLQPVLDVLSSHPEGAVAPPTIQGRPTSQVQRSLVLGIAERYPTWGVHRIYARLRRSRHDISLDTVRHILRGRE